MDGATVISAGEGELVGDAPDRRVEILSDHDVLHATVSRFGPWRAGANAHVHHRHSDLFYVLEGELTVLLGDREVMVPAGALAHAPPLLVHGFRNATDRRLRYLNLHAPGEGFADYLRGLADFDQAPPPPDGGRSADAAQLVLPGDGEVALDAGAVRVAERHAASDESPERTDSLRSCFVLEGGLTVRAGGSALHAPPGAWVQVPPGVEHAVVAAGAAGARYLDVRAPG